MKWLKAGATASVGGCGAEGGSLSVMDREEMNLAERLKVKVQHFARSCNRDACQVGSPDGSTFCSRSDPVPLHPAPSILTSSRRTSKTRPLCKLRKLRTRSDSKETAQEVLSAHRRSSATHYGQASVRPGGPTSPTPSQSSGFASLGASIQRATASAPSVAANDHRSTATAAIDPSATELLPFDEQAKLVYGVVFSLRNMVRKLGGDAETFNSFTTSTYTLAHLHTPTMYTLVIVTDPVPPPSSIPSRTSDGFAIGSASAALSGRSSFGMGGGIPGTGGMSLKGVLLQIYRGPWVDGVVRNPLLRALEREECIVEPDADAHNPAHAGVAVVSERRIDRTHGIDTDAFREGLEKVLVQNKLSAPAS
ncbi:40S ribosomal protein S4 [Moesziomyces antarcticus T-34]|uniref:40S ribosomal protein S4 n=1 Tax=Pseudozyma antarctica (strain T-34) TaxID=1151754 RepID=M9MBZ8_PSEA3|nr:40S ribosomal protein S4 [Moesziomyces antarcticus T-34]